ncbi:MAG: hypothetical protein Q9174_002701 [Haloplaca sp. 1 TL-2023]
MDHVPYPVNLTSTPLRIPLLWHDENDGLLVKVCKGSPSEGKDATCTNNQDGEDAPDIAISTSPDLVGLSSENATQEDGRHNVTDSDWTLTFWRYPNDRGWLDGGTQSWWALCPEVTARRAQEWLYFTLLSSFLERSIDTDKFSRHDEQNEQVLLNSALLPTLITQWIAQQHRHRSQQYRALVGESSPILSLLVRVSQECDKLDRLQEPAKSTSLAVRVLTETLGYAVRMLEKNKNFETFAIPRPGDSPLLEQRFLSNNWCPRHIALLSGCYSVSTEYYLSSLPRLPTFGGVKHNHCDHDRCISSTIDPATYKPRHAEPCSTGVNSCRMIDVESSQLADCIQRGQIPLIQFETSADGTLQAKIIESRNDLRYVAVSHVWSGGLGNVSANSMFACQMQRLRSFLRKIRDNGDDDLDRDRGPRKFESSKRDVREVFGLPVPEQPLLLWIDTLCVPVGSEYEGEKQKAIAQMAQIYVEAQCVLVIDPELQQMEFQNLPDEQIFANVLCSAWNSRSWTFQEACMARTFYVQFADGYCMLDQRWHDLMKRKEVAASTDTPNLRTGPPTFNMREGLMDEVSNWYPEMPVMTKIRSYDVRRLMTKCDDWENFARVWNGLRTRSTTQSDDLYGIIAIMVDLSAHEILRLKPKDRMQAILRSQSTLPLPLLYQDCAKIIDSTGVPSWAPSKIEGGHIAMTNGYMKVEDHGLLIDTFGSDAAHHLWPMVYMFSTENTLSPSSLIRLDPMGQIIGLQLSPKCSHVCPPGPWILMIQKMLHQGQITDDARGVLLRVKRVEGCIYLTEYFSPVRILIRSEPEVTGRQGAVVKQPLSTQPVVARPILLEGTKIKIISDLTSWHKPKLRMKKQLLSPWVVLRNMSNALAFVGVILTSVLYMLAIIACAVHHRQPVARTMLYLLIPRYFSHFLELLVVGRYVIAWDRDRISRWSTQLCGDSKLNAWQRVGHFLLTPTIITNFIPLIIASVSFGLYKTHGWIWAKWFAVTALAEIGVRLTYTWLLTFGGYPGLELLGLSKEDLSDLPEDMTNYSRVWNENNQRGWTARQKIRAKQKKQPV